MFSHNHYVPVLKWKAAERRAMAQIDVSLRRSFTPLVELVPPEFSLKKMRKAGDLETRVSSIVQQFAVSIGRYPFFLDMRHLAVGDVNRCRIFRTFDATPIHPSLTLIPVISPRHSEEVISTVLGLGCQVANGVCIRAVVSGDSLAQLGATLDTLVKNYSIPLSTADLVVDLGECREHSPSIVMLMNSIPNVADWRTVALLSGAFPVNLSHLPANDEYELPRKDWLRWRKQVSQANESLRLPAFGDYTIQHPRFQLRDFRRLIVSASIRYTYNEYWVIMRGQGLRKSEDFQQYPAQAELLMDRSEFCGANYSAGDAYIAQMAQRTNGTGNATTWLQAGFNHHITYVVRQLSGLFATAGAV